MLLHLKKKKDLAFMMEQIPIKQIRQIKAGCLAVRSEIQIVGVKGILSLTMLSHPGQTSPVSY